MINKEKSAEKKRMKIKQQQEKLIRAGKFKKWKSSRPFWGATMILLAGLLILYIPVQLYAIAFAPGSFAFVGLFFGGMMLIIGCLAYVYPAFSSIFGIMAIFLSILSVMGALGGFIVGTLLGIFGGALCVGWRAESITDRSDREWSRNATALEGGRQGKETERVANSALIETGDERKEVQGRGEQKQQA